MKATTMRFVFVEDIPRILADGVLYISVKYRTAAHRCCCGCGREVNTNLSPNGWQLTFDGRTVSLEPSIGNWSFSCQSHYWIRKNSVVWAGRWTKEQIDNARARRGVPEMEREHGQTSGVVTIASCRTAFGSAWTRARDRLANWWRAG